MPSHYTATSEGFFGMSDSTLLIEISGYRTTIVDDYITLVMKWERAMGKYAEVRIRNHSRRNKNKLWRSVKKWQFYRVSKSLCRYPARSKRTTWQGKPQKQKEIYEEPGKASNRGIIEIELLKSRIESNIGPNGEMTTKLTRHQKRNLKLSHWLIPYCELSELILTSRIRFLLSFLDPTANATSCIFPMVCKIVTLDATKIKQQYYGDRADIAQESAKA